MGYGATFSGPMLSFANCEIKVNGARQVGMPKIDLEDGVKAELEFGNGPLPLGAALGQWEGTLSIDQHKQEALALMAMLNAVELMSRAPQIAHVMTADDELAIVG